MRCEHYNAPHIATNFLCVEEFLMPAPISCRLLNLIQSDTNEKGRYQRRLFDQSTSCKFTSHIIKVEFVCARARIFSIG